MNESADRHRLRLEVQDPLLFELLSDAVPDDQRTGYRQLWDCVRDGDRLPCPACFATLHKNMPLRELAAENSFRRWRCTGCFTMFYRPPFN